MCVFGLLHISAHIVSKTPCSSDGGPNPFWVRQSSVPAAWLTLLFTQKGDVESKPSPTTISSHMDNIQQIKQTQCTPDWRCKHSHSHSTRTRNTNHLKYNNPSTSKAPPTHSETATTQKTLSYFKST